MKWCRYGQPGSETWGVMDEQGNIKDASGLTIDLAQPLPQLSDDALAQLPAVDGSVRLAPCVPRPGKLIGIGLNYSDHAAETGSKVPKHPILFMKANSAIIGPNDTVSLPRKSKDWLTIFKPPLMPPLW